MIRVTTVALALAALSMLPSGAAAQGVSLKVPASLKEQAPAAYNVRFETSAGIFVAHVERAWAPKAADRFYNLVKNGFYDGVRFYRSVPNFMAQFGLHGDPTLTAMWSRQLFSPDPVKHSNKRMTLSFAMGGNPMMASTQVFLSFRDNSSLDGQGFAAFADITEGQDVAAKIFTGYGDMPQRGGKGPDTARILKEGNAYLEREFPKLDYIKKATIEK
ncbi:MAG: peptidylprolyl isomerase [Vicinamibacterales bacterium]|jgi:peptidyl-prolyl cis-trans isomerase A (cyclophilin A)